MESDRAPSSIPIAIVDDDIEIRSLLSDYLIAEGFRVSIFNDVHQFMEAFSNDPERFFMVVGDLNMPGFRDQKITRQIKALAAKVLVIAVASPTPEMAVPTLRADQVDLILYKPFHLKRIRQFIDGHLSKLVS